MVKKLKRKKVGPSRIHIIHRLVESAYNLRSIVLQANPPVTQLSQSQLAHEIDISIVGQNKTTPYTHNVMKLPQVLFYLN